MNGWLARSRWLLFAMCAGCASTIDARMGPVIVLGQQQDAWNRGDVDGFMDGYHKSSDTTFSGSDGTTRGFDAVLDRYRKKYPDSAAMGKLRFNKLEVIVLSVSVALVTGEWSLERAHDSPSGVFSLVFVRFPEGWKIVHDHTSAYPASR